MPNVRLRWRERFNASQTRIYRSTSPIDVGALPTPLATLGAGQTDYLDTTAGTNTTYFYLIACDNAESPAATVFASATVATSGPPPDAPYTDPLNVYHSTVYVVTRRISAPKVYQSTVYVVVRETP